MALTHMGWDVRVAPWHTRCDAGAPGRNVCTPPPRRALGQKSGTWTAEKNARLVARMDKVRDTRVRGPAYIDKMSVRRMMALI